MIRTNVDRAVEAATSEGSRCERRVWLSGTMLSGVANPSRLLRDTEGRRIHVIQSLHRLLELVLGFISLVTTQGPAQSPARLP